MVKTVPIFLFVLFVSTMPSAGLISRLLFSVRYSNKRFTGLISKALLSISMGLSMSTA